MTANSRYHRYYHKKRLRILIKEHKGLTDKIRNLTLVHATATELRQLEDRLYRVNHMIKSSKEAYFTGAPAQKEMPLDEEALYLAEHTHLNPLDDFTRALFEADAQAKERENDAKNQANLQTLKTHRGVQDGDDSI